MNPLSIFKQVARNYLHSASVVVGTASEVLNVGSILLAAASGLLYLAAPDEELTDIEAREFLAHLGRLAEGSSV